MGMAVNLERPSNVYLRNSLTVRLSLYHKPGKLVTPYVNPGVNLSCGYTRTDLSLVCERDLLLVLCVTEGPRYPRATGNSDITPEWQDKEGDVRDAGTRLRKCGFFPNSYSGKGVVSGQIGRTWKYSDCVRRIDFTGK